MALHSLDDEQQNVVRTLEKEEKKKQNKNIRISKSTKHKTTLVRYVPGWTNVFILSDRFHK